MSLKMVIEAYELLDDARVCGQDVVDFVLSQAKGPIDVETCVQTAHGAKGQTDFVKFLIPGTNGKSSGGTAPTLGIVGRLGGIGARPKLIGLTSDGDGALSAVAVAAKLVRMADRGDRLAGDIIVTTHICPNAPTRPHEPVPFMDSPVTSAECNTFEVDERMDAILCVDTTKGNRIINKRGFAISPTVKAGWILRTSEDLLSIMQTTTGELPAVFALTMQDITPYGNDIYHLNSILQPSVATDAPCVGVAITTCTQVAGCATGATHAVDLDEVVRFCIEVAKYYGDSKCSFYDETEFESLTTKYGEMTHLQTMGRKA